jgi:hypothetical protein
MGSVTESPLEGLSIAQILGTLIRHPVTSLVRRWNWKSAVMSSMIRGTLFFATNLSAGFAAARAAFLTELLFRSVMAGFFGALTQAFRHASPAWTGTAAAMVLLPVTTHLLEFAVHWLRGTERLAASIAISVALTAVSTCFNLFAMRRGALIVGADSDTLWNDLLRTPRLFAAFVADALRSLGRSARRTVGRRYSPPARAGSTAGRPAARRL